jgi:hypothetical protein
MAFYMGSRIDRTGKISSMLRFKTIYFVSFIMPVTNLSKD